MASHWEGVDERLRIIILGCFVGSYHWIMVWSHHSGAMHSSTLCCLGQKELGDLVPHLLVCHDLACNDLVQRDPLLLCQKPEHSFIIGGLLLLEGSPVDACILHHVSWPQVLFEYPPQCWVAET